MFLSMSVLDLKKDYRRLAFELHPDRNSGVTLTKQKEVYADFYRLSEAYERLLLLFSRANQRK